MENKGAFLCIAFAFAVTAHFGESIKINQRADTEPLKWWQQDIIYQVYPRSHQDSNGDGIGDLKGIEQRLDHFVEHSIGAVWISPIYKSPMKDFGYDISNFTAIEPTFGTMEDFISLSNAMKKKDIKLIMDFVPNHSSDQHEWFEKSVNKEGKYTDYYVWKDPKGFNETGHPIPPTNWVNHFSGSMWTWVEKRQQFYLHQFLKEQPDLNYENPEVLKDILAQMKFWLDAGVDGFRLDAVQTLFEDQRYLDEPPVDNPPPGLVETDHGYWQHIYTINQPKVLDALAQFRMLIDIYQLSDGLERCMMTEQYLDIEETLKYYGTKERPIAHFPFNFDLIRFVDGTSNGTSFAQIIDQWYTKIPDGATVNWVIGNHDNKRVGTRFGEDAIDKLNILIMLLPGSVVTYYGEEIGMVNSFISWEDTVDPQGCNVGPERYHLFSRDPERTPMQWSGADMAGFTSGNKTWLPIHENFKAVNVEAEKVTAQASHLKVYKRVAELRLTPAWQYGSLDAKALYNGDIYGFSRIYNDTGFLFLSSFTNQTVTVDARSQFDNIPATAKVYTTSVGFIPETPIESSVDTGAIAIGGKHSIVVTFKKEENYL